MTMTRNKNEKSGLSVASHLLFAGKLSTQTSDTITALWRDILLMMMLMMLVMMMLMMTRMLVMVLMMMKKMLMIVFISITT